MVTCLSLVRLEMGMSWAMAKKGPRTLLPLSSSVRVAVSLAGVLADPWGRGILRKAPIHSPHEPRALVGGGENLTHLVLVTVLANVMLERPE